MARKRKALVALIAMALVLGGAAAWVRLGRLPTGFLDRGRFVSTVIEDRHGEVLYESLSDRSERSQWIEASDIPPIVMNATIAAEDRRFFRHFGVDPIAITRAAFRNLVAMRAVEGGSTITQQVVKLVLAARHDARPAKRGFRQKIAESVLAIRLEHRLSKTEILALYLNLAPYGNQYTGIARASRGYFSIAPGKLTVAQAAFLAGLPQRPSAFDPIDHRTAALKRQKEVLSRMFANGVIDRDTASHAVAERIRIMPPLRGSIAPHFVERVRDELGQNRFARVRTTLDAPLQREVRSIIEASRANLERHGANNVAVVVLDNRTGDWLAWEGSGNYFDAEREGMIDGAITPRQPGSALKPFTYAVAFERGFTPASVLPDVPSHFDTAAEGVKYAPRNYDGEFRGPLRARVALAGSENVPAVWLLSRCGPSSLTRLLREASITTLDRSDDYYGLGVTLGDAEVRLDELVAAYALFARDGLAVESAKILAMDGRAVPRRGEKRRLISRRSAFWISDILSDSRARAWVFGEGGSLDFPFPVAAKTGTSQAYHDNWTIGFTRDVTVGVWVGNFDRTPLRNSSGVTGAAPIFHQVMLAAEKRVHGEFPSLFEATLPLPPADLARRPVCALSGEQPNGRCTIIEYEWLPKEAPYVLCSWHETEGVAWPPAFRAWAREKNLPASGGHIVANREHSLSDDRMRISNPPAGAVYLIDPTLRSGYQTLPLRVVTPSRETVTWEVNHRAVGRADSDESFHWPLRKGRIEIRVRDDRGRSATTTIFVK